MTPPIRLLLALLTITEASPDLSESIASFDGFDGLVATGASPQCVQDMGVYSKSLAEFVRTAKSCLKEGECDSAQKEILKQNMFAAKQLDASGKLPPGVLEMTLVSSGSYYECNELLAPYETHYCYAGIQFSNMSGGMFNEKLTAKLALCMPRNCSETDIPQLMSSIVKKSPVPLEFLKATCVPTSVEPTATFWIFMSFAAIVVLWAVLATVADYVLHVHYNSKIKKTPALATFLAFSFYSNGAILLDVAPPKEGIIRSLASIRFISMSWVAAGHTIGASSMSESLLPMLALWNPMLSTTFSNAFLSVDTFFLLSGILVAYLFFKSRPSPEFVKNPGTWVLYYVHRYLRLTPPIMIFIWFFVVVLPFTDGPWSAAVATNFFGSVEENMRVCQQNWWRNMLYINNFFNATEDCYAITWYLAVDTQLYVVAPIFLIALYISPFIGSAVLLLFTAASVVYTYIITYRDDLPAVAIGSFEASKESLFFNEFYMQPWTRCTPYLVGLGVGYFLAQCIKRKPRLPKLAIVFGWIVAVLVAICCLYGVHGYQKGDDDWNKFTRGTYNNLSRIGWAMAVSWVIVANHLGWGGLIATFMDHPLWQPLGKLSYCAYIVHFFVIRYVFNLDDRPFNLISIWQSYVYRVIPVIVLSYVFAFIWSCLFEIPTTNLERILITAIIPQKKTQAVCSKPTSSWNTDKELEKDDDHIPHTKF